MEQNLRIPTPKLYTMWQEQDGQLYIVMEYLPGDTLESLWSELTEPEKQQLQVI